MTPAHDDYLCKKYPLIFKHRHESSARTPMGRGFEVEDGWFDLIDVTCEIICARYHEAQSAYERCRKLEGTARYKGAAIVTAVDVERARLAMTEAEKTVPVALQVKEKFGTLRFYVSVVDATVDSAIGFAERFSGRICEECGAPGTLRGSGWYRTRCAAHDPEIQSPTTFL